MTEKDDRLKGGVQQSFADQQPFADFIDPNTSYKPKKQTSSGAFAQAIHNPEIMEQQRLAVEQSQKKLINSIERKNKKISDPEHSNIDHNSVS